VGVRLLDAQHERFEDVARVVLKAASRPAYLMIPKPQGAADLERAAAVIDALGGHDIPLHALVETHGALREVFALAAHPRIESLSFGLMDFVSAHRGAIPQSAMGVVGQFTHPLVLRAKLEIAAACHAHGKVPSHCVVTEFKDLQSLQAAARKAAQELGYTRMWSIHPDQIRPKKRSGRRCATETRCMTGPATDTSGSCCSVHTATRTRPRCCHLNCDHDGLRRSRHDPITFRSKTARFKVVRLPHHGPGTRFARHHLGQPQTRHQTGQQTGHSEYRQAHHGR
jgi:hypothetical protein